MITKLLSLDGGGTKGVFHAYFLNELEKTLGSCVRDSFDYIGGTSIGGILALVLTHPLLWMNNRNDFKIEDLLAKKIEEKLLSVIFGPPRSCFMPPRLGLFGSKYGDRVKHMQDFYTNEFFGNQNFGSDCAKPTMIFSYSLVENAAKIFKSWRPNSQEFPVPTVARATSAAPMFFPAVSYKGDILIDGGVAANDPSFLMGYEARKNAGNLQAPLIIVSLGTCMRGYTEYKSCYSGGMIDWASKFVSLTMETQQRITTYLQGHDTNCALYCDGCIENNFHEMLGPDEDCYADYHYWNNVHYFRFAPLIEGGLDITDPKLLNGLKVRAQTFFNSNSKIITKMIGLLKTIP